MHFTQPCFYPFRVNQGGWKFLLIPRLNPASDPPQQQQNEYDQKDQANPAAGIGSPTLTVAPCGQGSDEENDQNDYQDNSHGIPPLEIWFA
jgi:hypothetical protein